jgi:hypothetical protein
MDLLTVLAVVVGWLALQTWILPRLGIATCCAAPHPRRSAGPRAADGEDRRAGGC